MVRVYDALAPVSQGEARSHFLRSLRALPYGNCIFFGATRLEDPSGLLPVEVVVGINHRGVHLFRRVPKDLVLSVRLHHVLGVDRDEGARRMTLHIPSHTRPVVLCWSGPQCEDLWTVLLTHMELDDASVSQLKAFTV